MGFFFAARKRDKWRGTSWNLNMDWCNIFKFIENVAVYNMVRRNTVLLPEANCIIRSSKYFLCSSSTLLCNIEYFFYREVCQILWSVRYMRRFPIFFNVIFWHSASYRHLMIFVDFRFWMQTNIGECCKTNNTVTTLRKIVYWKSDIL